VEELSDRKEGEKPDGYHPFYKTIPLVEILSEVLKVGPASKKVTGTYRSLIKKMGPEFDILTTVKKEIIDAAGIPLLGEAISRVRRGEINLIPGFDGEFGKIKIFSQDERNRLLGQKSLFIGSPSKPPCDKKKKKRKASKKNKPENETEDCATGKITGKKFEPGKLNQNQKKVVSHKSGPLMVVAGPGTGKTHTLTQRIAHIIKTERGLPEQILAVTFTNKAAQEMRQRLERLLDRPKKSPFIGTFHSFCFDLLNNYENKKRSLIDDNDRLSLVSDAIQNIEGTGVPVDITPKRMLEWIVLAKQRILEPGECGEEFPEFFLPVHTSYQNLLTIQNLYDYEDLIFNTVRILETDHRFCATCIDLYRFVFVDEYQDLNYGQYRLIKALVPPGSNRNICVIGDPDQSIYGFRGSSVKYFKRFVKDHPGTEVVHLTKNYRSTQTILDASYQVIEPQKKDGFNERIYSEIHGEKTIRVIDTYSEKSEAVAVGKAIEQLIGGMGFHSFDFNRVGQHQKTSNISFSDVAVLYRTSKQHKIISKVFDDAGIPHQIVSRKKLFDETGIRELISLVKILDSSGSYSDFERILNVTKPTVGKQSGKIFKKWCYKNQFSLKKGLINAHRFPINGMSKTRQKRLSEFLDNILEMKQKTAAMSMEEKLIFLSENTRLSKIFNKGPNEKEALKQLLDIFRNFGFNKTGIWPMAVFGSDTDTYSHQSEKVALMTMHAAKGLEFPVVFVVGCEKGFLPFQRPDTDGSPPDIEEEQRLFYVAMTRAKQRLYLTFAKKRRIFGKIEKRELSPFVREIEEHLLTHEGSGPGKKKRSGPSQLKLF
jgi:superfamily I DNA/RNA helicase